MLATDKEKALVRALFKKGQQLLRQLGETRGQVAAMLRRSDIKGYREDSDQCPVANWLNQRIADDDALCSVSDSCIRLWPLPICDVHVEIDMPKPVRDFVHAFDKRGMYANLEDW